MATRNVGPESAPNNITIAEVSAVAAALRRLDQIDAAPVMSADDRIEIAKAKLLCWAVIGDATEALVSLMDALAGDPDIEANGDEADASACAEDEFIDHITDGQPGCPVSDPGGCEHDGREPEDGF